MRCGAGCQTCGRLPIGPSGLSASAPMILGIYVSQFAANAILSSESVPFLKLSAERKPRQFGNAGVPIEVADASRSDSTFRTHKLDSRPLIAESFFNYAWLRGAMIGNESFFKHGPIAN